MAISWSGAFPKRRGRPLERRRYRTLTFGSCQRSHWHTQRNRTYSPPARPRHRARNQSYIVFDQRDCFLCATQIRHSQVSEVYLSNRQTAVTFCACVSSSQGAIPSSHQATTASRRPENHFDENRDRCSGPPAPSAAIAAPAASPHRGIGIPERFGVTMDVIKDDRHSRMNRRETFDARTK
jgi:hypothetical protein